MGNILLRKFFSLVQFPLSKTKIVNPEFLFSKSEDCPKFVQSEKWHYFQISGQALDNLWICLSNACPSVSELDSGSTELGLYLDSALTDSLQDLFLDSH